MQPGYTGQRNGAHSRRDRVWWGLSQPTVVLRTEHNLNLKNRLCLEMLS